MAMIAAVEFNYVAAARGCARYAKSGHDGFGAGIDEADLLNPRDLPANKFSQLQRIRFSGTIRPSAAEGGSDGIGDFLVLMPENHRPPGRAKIKITLSILRPNVRPFSLLDENRISSDRLEGPNRTIDAAREEGSLCQECWEC